MKVEQDIEMVTLPMLLSQAGDANRYQWRLLAIMCAVMFTISMHINGQAFMFITPPLLCDGLDCDDVPGYCDGNYEITVDAGNFKYRNVVTQFALWCDKKYLISLSQSFYFLGNVIGGSTMSYISDTYGRSRTYLISWGIACFGIVGIQFSYSIYQLMIMNCIFGFGAIATYILNFVILNEASGVQFRQHASIVVLVSWSIAEVVTVIVYYLITDWKIIFVSFVLAPALLEWFLILLMRETPQFYLAKKQYDKMFDSLLQMAKTNNRQLQYLEYLNQSQQILDPQLTQNDISNQIVASKVRNYNFIHLFTFKSLRSASIGFTILSFVLHILYYGSEYSLSAISEGNSVYILGGVMGMSEVFATCLMTVIIPKLPRKKSMIGSLIMSVLCSVGFLSFGWDANSTKTDCSICGKLVIVILLSGLIRIFNSFGFAIQGLYANEVYPTPVRTLGTGFLFAVGLTGSFCSPYVLALGDYLRLNPYFLIGIISIAGPFGAMMIKETFRKELADQITEVQTLIDEEQRQLKA